MFFLIEQIFQKLTFVKDNLQIMIFLQIRLGFVRFPERLLQSPKDIMSFTVLSNHKLSFGLSHYIHQIYFTEPQ